MGCYGEGGALFTSDDDLADKMRAIRTHGGIKRHHHPLVGMNGRFDTLQAAVLLAKWPHFEKEVQAYEAADKTQITVKLTKQDQKKVGKDMVAYSRLETTINSGELFT